jgi:hypothetical protein
MRAAAAWLVVALAACSSSSPSACSAGSDCAPGDDCLFPATDTNDCAAAGECVAHDSLPPATACGAADFRCTCSGAPAMADLVCGPGDVYFATVPTGTNCPG